jgi:hypothetical protein
MTKTASGADFIADVEGIGGLGLTAVAEGWFHRGLGGFWVMWSNLDVDFERKHMASWAGRIRA